MARPFYQAQQLWEDKYWRILLLNGNVCHEAGEFVLKAKMNIIILLSSYLIKLTLFNLLTLAVLDNRSDINNLQS